MRRFWAGALIAGLWVAAGLGVSGLINLGIIPNAQISLNFSLDLAGLSSRLGLALGAITLGLAGLLLWWSRRLFQARQQERDAQSEGRKRFLQRLDHELKNPLTIIRLGLTNLQQASLNDEQARSLTRVDDQAQRLQKLVTDLRLLTELDHSRLEGQNFDLKAALQEAIDLANDATSEAAGGRSVSLAVQDTPWPLSPVWGDYDLLVLAFRNLLDNALKFTQPGDRVVVRATEDGRMAIVEVADTGMGIPPEEIGQVFEELYRGQNARGIPGSGLGLKLVERIVSLHGGEVGVRSKPGQGTVFTVRLPLG